VPEERVKHVAEIRVSNVDKKAVDGELPVRLCNYTDVYYHEQITAQLDFMAATATPSQRDVFRLRTGDVVLTKDSETADDIGVSAVVAENVPDLVCGYHLALVRPRTGRVDGRYLRWALASAPSRQQMSVAATGVTRFGLRSDSIADLRVPVPALDVQQAVAGYLDREAGRIDALVRAKGQMVDLLAEKRSELASDLILGPPIPDSGAGPGQVSLPPRWELLPFRRLFREVDVRSKTGAETLLSVSQTRGVIPQAELGDRRQYADTLIGYKLCMPGDLVVNRMWVYYGALGAASVAGIVSPDYAVFRPTADMSSEFAAYVLRTPAYVGEMTRLVRGIGAAFQGAVRKPRLHPRELGIIEMPVPPPVEEQRILRELDERTERIAQQVSLLQRSIKLLQERRGTLVADAITGRLSVLGAA
jgi:type I restriction enzyme S subunit